MIRSRARFLSIMVIALVAQSDATATASAAGFTDSQKILIREHGPWPPARRQDPTNPWSGNPSAIGLGARLFGEKRLSVDAAFSCRSCHRPELFFTDGLPLGVGWRTLERNTPTLFNLTIHTGFGWDGKGGSLWAQSVRPILAAAEMNANSGSIRALLERDPDYYAVLRNLTGSRIEDLGDDEIIVVVGRSLAAYQEVLVTPRSPFDEFRDSFLGGDAKGASSYPNAAFRGLGLFTGRAGCSRCHSGPFFTSGEVTGARVHFTNVLPSQVDQDRFRNRNRPANEDLNRIGPTRNDVSGAGRVDALAHAVADRDAGKFKVPGLRNVSSTGPYMHDGRYESLEDLLRHYSPPGYGSDRVHGRGGTDSSSLTDLEISDLVAFLESLSHERSAGHSPGN